MLPAAEGERIQGRRERKSTGISHNLKVGNWKLETGGQEGGKTKALQTEAEMGEMADGGRTIRTLPTQHAHLSMPSTSTVYGKAREWKQEAGSRGKARQN